MTSRGFQSKTLMAHSAALIQSLRSQQHSLGQSLKPLQAERTSVTGAKQNYSSVNTFEYLAFFLNGKIPFCSFATHYLYFISNNNEVVFCHCLFCQMC